MFIIIRDYVFEIMCIIETIISLAFEIMYIILFMKIYIILF